MATIHSRPRGNILLLALLLLAGGIIGALTVATLVVSDLHQAQALDNGLVAYAKAESGLEQTLYDIRQASYCDTAGHCTATAYAACGLPNTTSTSLNSTVECDRKISPTSVVNVPFLETNQTFQMDFTTPLSTSNTFRLFWNRFSATQVPALEVSYLELVGGQLQVSRPLLGQPYSCGASTNSTVCAEIDLPFPDVAGASLYQIRFRALSARVVNLKIVSDTSAAPGYLDVRSRGSQGSTNQVLQTIIPQHAPAYGFSDYVIFSEQDIVK